MRFLAGLSLLLLVGMYFGTSTLVYAAYVLLAVAWSSQRLSQRWITAVRATRTINASEIEIGSKLSVQIRLDNRDRFPVAWVFVEDLLPLRAVREPHAALSVEGANLRMCSLPAHSSRVIAYQLIALRRGYYQIGPAVAETGDLLGLQRRFRQLTDASYVLVLPKLIPLAGYDVASRRPVGEVKVSYRLNEDPTLVNGIRQYEIGDPLRSIHWRATARTGQLQCKQYQPTSVAGAMLVVDLHRFSNPDRHEPLRSDLAVTAAASICHTLMQMQQQFGLISNGRDAADRLATLPAAKLSDGQRYASMQHAKQALSMQARSDRLRPIVVPVGRDPEHFTHIYHTLARLERTDGLRLEELLIETQSRMPRDATVLVILQEVDEAAALALGMLRRRGYSVAAIVNNYENEAFTAAMGRLLAQRIAVYHLFDESSVGQICKELALRY